MPRMRRGNPIAFSIAFAGFAQIPFLFCLQTSQTLLHSTSVSAVLRIHTNPFSLLLAYCALCKCTICLHCTSHDCTQKFGTSPSNLTGVTATKCWASLRLLKPIPLLLVCILLCILLLLLLLLLLNAVQCCDDKCTACSIQSSWYGQIGQDYALVERVVIWSVWWGWPGVG